jgi:hypothetical protein
MNYRIRYGFAHSHIYSKSNVLADTNTTQKLGNSSSGFINSPNTAGEPEFSRL